MKLCLGKCSYAFMSSAYVSSLTPVRPLLSTHSTQQDQGQMREQSWEEGGRGC